MCGRGVGPGVAQGPESGLLSCDRGEGVEQVAGGSGQAIEPRHHEHVASVELVERATELAAVGLGSARHFAEDLLASCLGKCAHLGVHTLTVG